MGLGDHLRKAIGKRKPLVWKRRPEVLLSDNIPQPLHGVAPRCLLGNAWWNTTRQAAYRSTGFHCIACGVHKFNAKSRQWLEGHELYRIDYQAGRMYYLETVPLCHFCHNYIHDGRMLALLEKHQIPVHKFVRIIQHGDAVLAAEGLFRLTHAERDKLLASTVALGNIAQWSTWRLVINGVEYPPKWENVEQWSKHYGRPRKPRH